MSRGLVVHLLFTLIVQTKIVGGRKHVGWYSVDINQHTVPESEVKPLCHTYFGSFPYLCRAPDVGDHDDSNTDSGPICFPCSDRSKFLNIPVQTEFCSLKWGTKGFSGEKCLFAILSFFLWWVELLLPYWEKITVREVVLPSLHSLQWKERWSDNPFFKSGVFLFHWEQMRWYEVLACH